MKKFLLSIFVISSFVFYSINKKINFKSEPVIGSSNPNPTNNPIPNVDTHYKDGTYTGTVADAFYGNVQVQTTVQNGLITNVNFLQYPNDRRNSIEINSQAIPFPAEK